MAALYVFGSVARDEATPSSDADLLIEFDGRPTFAWVMDLKALLEDVLPVRVNLVTRPPFGSDSAPRSKPRHGVSRDASLYVAELREACDRVQRFSKQEEADTRLDQVGFWP
jgi:predicted nucleotidyltransferase